MPDTFLFVAHPDSDFSTRRAATTVATGYCHGFEQLGYHWGLVKEPDLEIALDSFPNPIVFTGYDNYNRLTDAALKKLRSVPHVVWVSVWFDGMEELATRYSHPAPTLPTSVLHKIIDSEPSFVFCNSTENYFHYWENWVKSGMRLESLPEACDTTVYYPHSPGLENVAECLEVVYVGGYFPHKDTVYEKFLWPYENRLTCYGYHRWPRCDGGYLPNNLEATVYEHAKVVPAIGEPYAWEIGSLYERPFKVLGSGGLTITDTQPSYRELFTDDELLVPRCAADYHDLMNIALTDYDWNRKWRQRGLKAVLSRHTYRHRAERIVRLLDL